ncbi:MAG: outer membrane beta-barrel protein [Pseudomonadota bacterium]
MCLKLFSLVFYLFKWLASKLRCGAACVRKETEMQRYHRKIAGTIVLALAGTSVGYAQQVDYYSRDKYESVLERKQPEYDPEPIRVGSFSVNAKAEAGLSSTDNVFASETNEESDVLFRLGGAASAKSDWSNNEVGIDVSAYRNEYADFSDESTNNFTGQLRGRLDVTRGISVSGRVFAEDRAEQRTDLTGSIGVDRPVQFTRSGGGVRASYQNDRVQVYGGADFISRDFDDARSIVDGSNIDQDFRDRDEVSFDARASYAISPDVAFFAQGRTYDVSFDNDTTVDAVARSRDATGYTVQVGANFELQSLVGGDIAIGYLEENKKDEFFGDVDGLSIQGTLDWYPSRLTTVTASAGRKAADIGVLDAPSGTQTDLGLNVAHEFRRNILGMIFVKRTEYDAEGVDRTDEIDEIGASVTYKINRRVHVQGYARGIDRDISGIDSVGSTGYDNSVIGLGITIFP